MLHILLCPVKLCGILPYVQHCVFSLIRRVFNKLFAVVIICCVEFSTILWQLVLHCQLADSTCFCGY